MSAGVATAQCGLVYHPSTATPDADGAVLASCLWDPDGAGPLPRVVVLGGQFTSIGNVFTRGIAVFDPATGDCATLGSGLGISGPSTSSVSALYVTPFNELIAGGVFTGIDGVATSNVAKWNGVAWQSIGPGVPNPVFAFVALPSGDLLVGTQSLQGASSILGWDGNVWSPFGGGLAGAAQSLAVLPNGELVAGGTALLPGTNIVIWNGVSWSQLGSGLNAAVLALQVDPTGGLWAGGTFSASGAVPMNFVSRWNGSAWTNLGGGLPSAVTSMTRTAGGDLVVGGVFHATGSISSNQVARWDGTNWSGLGSGLGHTFSISTDHSVRTVVALPSGDVVGGGYFDSEGGDANFVARWDGGQWRQLRAGTGGAVRATAVAANGDLLVAGDFTTFEGVAARHVVRRSGGVWQPLGSGAEGVVYAVLPLASGDVVIGGDFTAAGGTPANCVARWDGSSWQALGGGLPGAVHSLAVGPFGQILASGQFYDSIAVWDGQAWSGTGIAGITPYGLTTTKLTSLPDGSVIAHTSLAGSIGRWDGFGWVPVATSPNGAGPIAVLGNGDIVVSAFNRVMRLSATSWSSLGGYFNGAVNDIVPLPDDGLIVGGAFTANGTTSLSHLARWDGTGWLPVGSGANRVVYGLRWQPDGTVFVAGDFASLDGAATGGLGTLSSTCAAGVTTQGMGCTGSGGVNVLVATVLPWIGGEYASRAEGLPTSSIVLEVLGLGAIQQPLSAVLPQAGPACELRATPDLLRAYVATGSLGLTLGLPNTASLIGATFVQQAVAIELDAVGGVISATSSNALQASIGAF